jgi:hypothetical protein
MIGLNKKSKVLLNYCKGQNVSLTAWLMEESYMHYFRQPQTSSHNRIKYICLYVIELTVLSCKWFEFCDQNMAQEPWDQSLFRKFSDLW